MPTAVRTWFNTVIIRYLTHYVPCQIGDASTLWGPGLLNHKGTYRLQQICNHIYVSEIDTWHHRFRRSIRHKSWTSDASNKPQKYVLIRFKMCKQNIGNKMWPFRFVAILVCGRFGLWPFRLVAVPVCGRSGLWPFRSVAVPVCGRFGLWPFRSVAVPVCGRFGLLPFRFVAVPVCGRFGLWPFRFVAVSVCGRFGSWPFRLWPFRFVAVMTCYHSVV